jgi:hypothetical protein
MLRAEPHMLQSYPLVLGLRDDVDMLVAPVKLMQRFYFILLWFMHAYLKISNWKKKKKKKIYIYIYIYIYTRKNGY